MRALIIHDGFKSRNQLKQVLERFEDRAFEEVKVVSRLTEGLERLREHRDYCWIFVGANYDRSDLAEFMEHARREAPQAAFIEVLHEKEADRKALSKAMVFGFHGAVAEPFSVLGVEKATGLVEEVRKTQTFDRLRTATGLMISALLHDSNAEDKKNKVAVNLTQEVEDCCRKYREVTGDSVTTFITAHLADRPISKRVLSYDGVSTRVRDLVAKKLGESADVFHNLKRLFAK